MAKLVEILQIEQSRADAEQRRVVHLFSDGTFYRAYEWSAWLCCRYINTFQVTKRYNKSVESDMVFIGFPKTSLSKFTPNGAMPVDAADGHIVMSLPETLVPATAEMNKEFENWKTTIPVARAKEKPQPVLDDRPVSMTGIMKRVLEYNVLEHSPIECMQFVTAIQRQLVEIL